MVQRSFLGLVPVVIGAVVTGACTAPPSGRDRQRPAPVQPDALAHTASIQSEAGDAAPLRADQGLLTVFLENDIVLGSDDEYTSGIGFSWVSPPVDSFSPKNFFRQTAEAVRFLPTFDDPAYERFVSFTLGQEMYTPTDITDPDPPLGEQPYAGILFLDTAVHSRSERSLHSYKLRVGVVGPASGAAEVQEFIHKVNRSPQPRGWDTQLSNEPLLNLDYRYDRRIGRGAFEEGPWGYDFSASGGGGVGNYQIGASAGLQGRIGLRLPDNYGPIALRAGGAGLVGIGREERWRAYLYVEGHLLGVARFLPTDGNTFEDSRSTDRDDFAGSLVTGLVIGKGRLLFHYALHNIAGVSDFQNRASDFGTIAVSYRF